MLEALRAGREIDRILMADEIEFGPQLSEVVVLADQQAIAVDAVPKRELDRISHTAKHQGVIAIVADPRYSSIEDMLHLAADRDEAPLLVVLDGIQDPHNFGAIARTANAAGAHGVIIPERRSASVSPGAIRASAGALEHVLVAREPNLGRTAKYLKQLGLRLVGLDAEAEFLHTEIDLTAPTAVVVGSEGQGISPQVRKECETLVSIPMFGEVASLNASVSAGVVLYEAVRQRTTKGAASS